MAERLLDKRPKYKKGLKKLVNSGDVNVVKNLLTIEQCLVYNKPIDPSFKPHPLKGMNKGFMSCHPAKSSQWVLVYYIPPDKKSVALMCLGSHGTCYDNK